MASLAARGTRKGFDKPDIAKDDNSFAEAIGLYAREVLTGRKLPESCNGIMAAWRKEIEAKAAPQMEALKDLLDNQQDFGRSVRDLIQDFDLGDDLADPEENEDSDEDSSENDDQQPDQSPDTPREEQQGQTEVSDADAQEDDSADPQDMVDAENIDGESDDADQTPNPNAQRPQPTNLPDPYTIYTNKHDEVIKAEELCETEELDRLRGYLYGGALLCHCAARQSFAAPLARAATTLLDI